jgi:serine/threonine protein kinase
MHVMSHLSLLKLLEFHESGQNRYLLFEHAPHRLLFDQVQARQRLTELDAFRFFRQIIYGLEYLHAHEFYNLNLIADFTFSWRA